MRERVRQAAPKNGNDEKNVNQESFFHVGVGCRMLQAFHFSLNVIFGHGNKVQTEQLEKLRLSFATDTIKGVKNLHHVVVISLLDKDHSLFMRRCMTFCVFKHNPM